MGGSGVKIERLRIEISPLASRGEVDGLKVTVWCDTERFDYQRPLFQNDFQSMFKMYMEDATRSIEKLIKQKQNDKTTV